MVDVVGPPGKLAAMSSADAEPGYRAIAGPSWRNEVAARVALGLALYRPGLQAGSLPCPILIQIADRDAIAPVKAAQDAAWLATGRAEVRTYPIGHFEIYRGAPFEKAVADQLRFLGRHLGGSRSTERLAGASQAHVAP
jgi:pimeloyl-ACP methyl ester carboxylesterase